MDVDSEGAWFINNKYRIIISMVVIRPHKYNINKNRF